MKLIVYHIYCVNDYLTIVTEQFNRLLKSGLYEWCDVIEITCTDTTGDFKGIDEIFKGFDKVNLNKFKNNMYEYYSIKKIWDYSQKYSGKVLYFHSKGVSNKYKKINTEEISEWKIDGIKWWREIMEYFLIDNWEECLMKLETNDTCGVTNVDNWYWGNFWWSNLNFIKDNPEPIGAGRWYYEDWLHHGRKYDCNEFWHFEFNPYFSNLPKEIYRVDNWYKNKSEIKVKSAFYGSIDVQQDEGCAYIEKPQQSDVTEIISNKITKEGLFVRSDNDLIGDPHFGVRKFLIVNLNVDDQEIRYVINEGKNLVINFI